MRNDTSSRWGRLVIPEVRGSSVGTLMGITIGAVLMLSGCSSAAEPPRSASAGGANTEADAESPADDQPAAQKDAGSATAQIGGQEFSFTLAHCIVYQASEVELGGPGGEVGSDAPSYLDGGLMEMDADVRGEFRINIGTDRPFDSTDDFVALGDSLGGKVSVTQEGDGYLVTAGAWNSAGDDLGAGTLRFTC